MKRDLDILDKMEKELSLKQLQIKSLLTITQAINDNVTADGLFKMYTSFLSWDMAIEKMALFIISDTGWTCASSINYEVGNATVFIDQLLPYRRMHTIKDSDADILQDFDIIIPVFHKDLPISYAIIGGIKNKEDLYNKIQFITTITNIISVAIENKRLFKQQIVRERLQREMELASEVQSMLIPKTMPVTEHFALDSIYKPHFTVGGDYLDYIKFSDTRFAFLIADISGKGVAAALLMANFQATIQSLIYQYRDLETFVFALNQSVHRITNSDRFITFFIGEVDTQARTLKYINAGHYPPVLVDDNGLRRLDKGCTVIGAFERLPDITEELISLAGDATVLTFTDGLADLRNSEGEYFEDSKIEAFVQQHHQYTPQQFNSKLLEEIDRFRGDEVFEDDIAILTCKIT